MGHVEVSETSHIKLNVLQCLIILSFNTESNTQKKKTLKFGIFIFRIKKKKRINKIFFFFFLKLVMFPSVLWFMDNETFGECVPGAGLLSAVCETMRTTASVAGCESFSIPEQGLICHYSAPRLNNRDPATRAGCTHVPS